MMQRALLALPIGALALLAALPTAGAAQTPDPEAPVVVYQNIKDGDTITEPAFVIHLCFDRPVNVKDLDVGGAFLLELNQPDGIGLGHGDVFQVDGYGLAIYPGGGPVGSKLTGEWTFKYRVTSPDAQHSTIGTIKYIVDPAGQPIPRETPPPCVASGGTATASPVPTGPTPSVVVIVGGVPSVSGGAETPNSSPGSGSPTPIVTRGPGDAEDDGDGPDILKLALITVGITGGAAALALIGYFVRRRVGYEPHKPKPGDGDEGGHH